MASAQIQQFYNTTPKETATTATLPTIIDQQSYCDIETLQLLSQVQRQQHAHEQKQQQQQQNQAERAGKGGKGDTIANRKQFSEKSSLSLSIQQHSGSNISTDSKLYEEQTSSSTKTTTTATSTNTAATTERCEEQTKKAEGYCKYQQQRLPEEWNPVPIYAASPQWAYCHTQKQQQQQETQNQQQEQKANVPSEQQAADDAQVSQWQPAWSGRQKRAIYKRNATVQQQQQQKSICQRTIHNDTEDDDDDDGGDGDCSDDEGDAAGDVEMDANAAIGAVASYHDNNAEETKLEQSLCVPTDTAAGGNRETLRNGVNWQKFANRAANNFNVVVNRNASSYCRDCCSNEIDNTISTGIIYMRTACSDEANSSNTNSNTNNTKRNTNNNNTNQTTTATGMHVSLHRSCETQHATTTATTERQTTPTRKTSTTTIQSRLSSNSAVTTAALSQQYSHNSKQFNCKYSHSFNCNANTNANRRQLSAIDTVHGLGSITPTSATTTTTTTPTTTNTHAAKQRKLFYYANYVGGRAWSAQSLEADSVATVADKPLATLRHVCEDSVNALADLQKFARTLFSLLIIFNMLPLFYAVASTFDASELRGGPNPEPHPRIPVVAYLEPLPRPTKSPKCDQTFVSRIGGPQNGTFSAPLLHNQKNHSRQCLYTFLAGPGQRVEVIFTIFNLRGSPPDGSAVGELPSCVHEYMDIYSEVQSSDPAELINSPFGGRYCGAIPPRRRISMYRAIAISFFTNKNVTTPDLFEGTYRFINASEYEIGIPIAGSPCSYTITPSMSINKTGALISPTYPGAYPKDMSCTYQFLGEANQRVRLEFRDFDLFFGGPHCPFDYVKVYDGPDNSSALIGTYCGQQRNLVLYSSESSLFVHFYTLPRTANTQNRGFKGIYEFSESFVKLDFIRENDGIHIRGSECDQKILSKKESTGNVLSPNYPYPYIPKTVCRYFIYGMQDAQHLERVRLEFTAFNIPKVEHKDKSESNCTDGYLKIYLKGQETADAYDKFDYELCGNETQRVVSDGPRLAMVFSSGELQGRGFKGRYIFETEYKIPGTAAPDGTCSFTYVSNSKKKGELNSPRYPSNYPSETNCSYLFLAESNEQVTIVFDHFKIKADGINATAGAYGSSACFEDWLEMYVVYRDNNDRFLGRYCGLTAPGPVESPRGAVGLRITLHTDHENVASGFKARYFFETAKSDVGDCGGNFSNEDSGIITSPNYPAGYKAPGKGMASMACNWIMTARPGYKLSINFEHFSIEGDPATRGCPAAVMRLWVNVESDQPPLELCGEKPPIEQWYYISTGQTARISFTTSDKTIGAQGFRIVWTEIQDSGPGPPSIGLLCESTYHFQCEVGYCISDKLRCDGVKNCGPGDDSDELHCITEAPEEDPGVLIIIALVVVLSLICLLCTLCHSRRKRRNHGRQLGLHRNAHYDSQTSATVGLSSSRRHLQSGGASISGSLHGINSGNLIIPPAPLPPTSVPPPPHICIAGVDIGSGMLMHGDDDDDLDDDDDDNLPHGIFINDVRFDEDTLEDLTHMENV